MLIHLQIAGGLAPPLMSEELTVDSTHLSTSQAADLQNLVHEALAETPPPLDPSVRDAMAYELRIECGEQVHCIVAFDGGLTPGIGRLINYVRKLGTRESRDA